MIDDHRALAGVRLDFFPIGKGEDAGRVPAVDGDGLDGGRQPGDFNLFSVFYARAAICTWVGTVCRIPDLRARSFAGKGHATCEVVQLIGARLRSGYNVGRRSHSVSRGQHVAGFAVLVGDGLDGGFANDIKNDGAGIYGAAISRLCTVGGIVNLRTLRNAAQFHVIAFDQLHPAGGLSGGPSDG